MNVVSDRHFKNISF